MRSGTGPHEACQRETVWFPPIRLSRTGPSVDSMPKQTPDPTPEPLRARMDALIDRLAEEAGHESGEDGGAGNVPALPSEQPGTSLGSMRSRVPGE